MKRDFSDSSVDEFKTFLVSEEKSEKTIEKYIHSVKIFKAYLEERKIKTVSKKVLIAYRASCASLYKPASLNTMIIGLNCFLRWTGKDSSIIKTVRVQNRMNLENIFSRADYENLLKTAKSLHMERCYLLMRLLALTGIRIDEAKFVTVEVIESGICTVFNKNKARTMYIPASFCVELKEYCKKNNIQNGIIFHGKNPTKLLDKAKIWRDMDKVAMNAGMKKGVVHAHSFRHFFAKEYFEKYHDLPDLADILGHSSLETTRIYTRTTSEEKRMRIEGLGL